MKMKTIYESGTYLSHNPTWHEEDSPWKAQQIDRMLQRNKIAPATVCEIGCGAGAILESLATDYDYKAHFSGYEISPQAFEICKLKERENLSLFLKDLLAEEGAHFDVLMAIDVFEHIEDFYSFLRKLRMKATYKIFHIPLDLSVQTVLRASPLQRVRDEVGHIHFFTKETALAALRDADYEVLDCFYTSSSLELPNQSWKSEILRWPRRILFSINQDFAVRLMGGYSLLVLAK